MKLSIITFYCHVSDVLVKVLPDQLSSVLRPILLLLLLLVVNESLLLQVGIPKVNHALLTGGGKSEMENLTNYYSANVRQIWSRFQFMTLQTISRVHKFGLYNCIEVQDPAFVFKH